MKHILLLLFITSSQTIYAQNPKHNWQTKLPDCPCMAPDKEETVLNDGWAKDKGDINKYHKGASSSYRSYPPVKTEFGKSGQQCCYDENGRLITSGSGAGTPDKISTCRGENKKGTMKLRLAGIAGHIKKDVKPWNKLIKENSNGWATYNKEWVPNNGKNCTKNEITH